MHVFRETIKYMKSEIESDQKYLDDLKQDRLAQPPVIATEVVEEVVQDQIDSL